MWWRATLWNRELNQNPHIQAFWNVAKSYTRTQIFKHTEIGRELPSRNRKLHLNSNIQCVWNVAESLTITQIFKHSEIWPKTKPKFKFSSILKLWPRIGPKFKHSSGVKCGWELPPRNQELICIQTFNLSEMWPRATLSELRGTP
jgi:hypothetical protein